MSSQFVSDKLAVVAAKIVRKARWPGRSVQVSVIPAGLAWLGLILSLIYLFISLSAADPSVLRMWLTSDTLYPVNVFTDTFIDGYSFSGWQFTIAPCWFPDVVLVGLFFALTQNVILATLFAGFVQIALIIGAFILIRQAVRPTQTVAQDVFLLGTGVGITLYMATRPGLYYPGLYQFFLPQTHIGNLCLVLYGLGLGLLCIRRAYESEHLSWRILLMYAAVSFVGGMSNLFYVVQMLAPLLASLLFAVVFGLLPLRVSILPLGIGSAAAAAGVMANRALLNATPVSAQSDITYERIMVSLDVFMRGLVANVLSLDAIHLLAATWGLVCIVYVIAILQIATKTGVGQLSLFQRMSAIFFLSCFFSTIFSISAIVIGGSQALAVFKDYKWSLHYLHVTFLLPFFGLPLAVAWVTRPELTRFYRAATYVVAVLALIGPAYCLVGAWPPPRPIHQYVPPLVQSIDDLATREGLRSGLAGYWQARLVTLLSKRGVRAYAIDGNLNPLLWISNREWYSQAYNDRSKKPSVDFVILDDPLWKISREEVVRVLGEPEREARCDGARVLIYAKRLTRK